MIIDLSAGTDLVTFAKKCGGVAFGNAAIDSVSIDSRENGKNTLFAAVKGENTDGHVYIAKAAENGAACVLCERMPEGVSLPYILVKDTIEALAEYARTLRNEYSPFTVGVTGSVGKTTTKEFVSAVLGVRYPTLKSGGNFNTIYGLTLTVASMNPIHKALVLEMGMSRPGEIEQMTMTALPDVAVITNVGTAHIENLGSRENIAKAKLEIVKGVKKGGCVVFNADEPLLEKEREKFGNSLGFGIANENSDAFGFNVRSDDVSATLFDIRFKGDTVKDVRIPAVGLHNVCNALSAFCVGKTAGLTDDEIKTGLMLYRTTGMRQKIYEKNGYTVIEDCYNASPESMKASISVLSQFGKSKRTVAVLGEMRELGVFSDELHKEVGEFVYKSGIDRLYTYGSAALEIAVGALQSGMDESKLAAYSKVEEPEGMAKLIKKDLRQGDVVLFKASRAVALENVIKYLD